MDRQYTNSWVPNIEPLIDTEHVLAQGKYEYDHNFCLPLREIENDRVKLVPFTVRRVVRGKHRCMPEMFKYYPSGPFHSLDAVVSYFERYSRQISTTMIYAILDKTRSRAASTTNASEPAQDDTRFPLAGTIGFLNTHPGNRSIEIGHLLVFPPFQRTHVTSNAIGLLTLFCLRPTSSSGGGLGLRRVQYQADVRNEASIRAAKRFGFVYEGISRWQRTIMAGKGGRRRPGDGEEVQCGIDVAVLSLCWDEWDEDAIISVMNRSM